MKDIDSIFYGGAIKDLGNGLIGGYAVLFSNENEPDLAGDFFTKATNFDLEGKETFPLFYAHSLDSKLDNRILGRGTLKADDVGLWYEAQLDLRDGYERAIYEMVKNQKLGYSTGSAAHLVRKEPVNGASFIKEWPLVEVSLTPTPCEPKTCAISLKALKDDLANTVGNEQLTSSQPLDIGTLQLRDHFDVCLLNVKVLTNRLNDLRELRINQKRKNPLSEENLASLKALHQDIEALIESTETAIEITTKTVKAKQQKAEAIKALYADAPDLAEWLQSI